MRPQPQRCILASASLRRVSLCRSRLSFWLAPSESRQRLCKLCAKPYEASTAMLPISAGPIILRRRGCIVEWGGLFFLLLSRTGDQKRSERDRQRQRQRKYVGLVEGSYLCVNREHEGKKGYMEIECLNGGRSASPGELHHERQEL